MGFTEFLKNISLIVASCTAIYGIGSWRREYRGKRQAELAEETLSLFYEARDAIKHIRHPFSYAGEGSTREESEKETEEEKKHLIKLTLCMNVTTSTKIYLIKSIHFDIVS
jgi:hypothetical protein